ncbi:MAG: hypothetical protein Q9178_003305 [Gyalolechia marmorata]
MVFYKPGYWTLIVAASTFGIPCPSAPQDASRSPRVIAPRLFSIAYPQESAENEHTTIGNGSQAETAMVNFVRERHNRNHLDGPSSSIDVFYDFVEGTAMIDAWFARLTNEDIFEFQQSFSGIVVEISDTDHRGEQEGIRKRADNDSCQLKPPTSEAATVADPPMQPTPLASAMALPTLPADTPGEVSTSAPARDGVGTTTSGPTAAAAVSGITSDGARLCLDECHSIFRKCSVDIEPGAGSRRRSAHIIDCQAAGNCYCTETPWRTGSTMQIDVEKADKICSDTCAAVSQGTQARQNGGVAYSFDDMWECLAQARGDQQPGMGQPAGCMGA